MPNANATTWHVLESLILVQAVYKYGEDSWAQVSRLLRGHSALSRPMEFFTPKNCEKHFQAMMAETIGADTVPVGTLAQDMLPMAKLARKLHLRRIEEINQLLKEDEKEFRELVQEIEEIRSGKWDDRLRAEWKEQHQMSEPAASKDPTSTTVEATLTAEAKAEPAPMEVDIAEADHKDAPTDVASKPSVSISEAKPAARRGRKPSTSIPPTTPKPIVASKPAEDSIYVDVGKRDKAPDTPPRDGESGAGEEKASDTTGKPEAGSSETRADEAPASPVKAKGFANRRGSLASHKVRAANSTSDAEIVDIDSGAENSDGGGSERKKTGKSDQSLQIWRKTVYFILAKIADHRYGNVFGAPVKEEGYQAIVKQPMSLDVVRARVRKGITTTTAEFHRDLLLMFTNAIMYNNEDSEVYSMALEMKDFVDAEVQHLTKYGTDPSRERSADHTDGGRARTEEPMTPADATVQQLT